MFNLKTITEDYLNFCQNQKRLNTKTLKAYRTDLTQFQKHLCVTRISQITPEKLETFIAMLHQTYKPRTSKRKIASLKAFFHYLEYRDMIPLNPLNKIQTKFREPVTLPKIIPLHTIEKLLSTMYFQKTLAKTKYQRNYILRDIAVIELLFSTGIRVSELCSLKPTDIDLHEKSILIYGKGSKERKIQIGNHSVASVLYEYRQAFEAEINNCGCFFVNRFKNRLSEQAVREIITKYVRIAGIHQHITPHMFRHSFATYLLEADVDIRYIQQMLGHSSIHITEIYTHVAMSKQKEILTTKHPRRNFLI